MLSTTPEQREVRAREGEWTTVMELLAQILEEISVLAADMRRKKPRQVPRPSYVGDTAAGRPAGTGGDAYADAIDRLLATPAAA